MARSNKAEQGSAETTDVFDRTEPAPDDGATNVVRYLGLVSDRRITREDWEQAGVSDQDGVMWTKDTGNTVPIDQFTEDALTVLAQQGEFQIVRGNED